MLVLMNETVVGFFKNIKKILSFIKGLLTSQGLRSTKCQCRDKSLTLSTKKQILFANTPHSPKQTLKEKKGKSCIGKAHIFFLQFKWKYNSRMWANRCPGIFGTFKHTVYIFPYSHSGL